MAMPRVPELKGCTRHNIDHRRGDRSASAGPSSSIFSPGGPVATCQTRQNCESGGGTRRSVALSRAAGFAEWPLGSAAESTSPADWSTCQVCDQTPAPGTPDAQWPARAPRGCRSGLVHTTPCGASRSKLRRCRRSTAVLWPRGCEAAHLPDSWGCVTAELEGGSLERGPE